jgi:hypothetical protein
LTAKFEVSARTAEVRVSFEPSGVEVLVREGDHILVEFPDGGIGGIEYRPGRIILCSGGGLTPLLAWESDGTEIQTFC